MSIRETVSWTVGRSELCARRSMSTVSVPEPVVLRRADRLTAPTHLQSAGRGNPIGRTPVCGRRPAFERLRWYVPCPSPPNGSPTPGARLRRIDGSRPHWRAQIAPVRDSWWWEHRLAVSKPSRSWSPACRTTSWYRSPLAAGRRPVGRLRGIEALSQLVAGLSDDFAAPIVSPNTRIRIARAISLRSWRGRRRFASGRTRGGPLSRTA